MMQISAVFEDQFGCLPEKSSFTPGRANLIGEHGIRDYIHLDDIALAHINAMQAMDQGLTHTEVNIGTGAGYSVLEILRMVEKVTGLAVPYDSVPRRDGDLTRLYADAANAKKILGFVPKHSDLS